MKNSSVLCGILFAGIAIITPHCLSQKMDWPTTLKGVQEEYPEINFISTDSLATLLAADTDPKPAIFDIRQEKEYAVSHLPKAKWLEPGTQKFTALDSLSKEQMIVVYCSVGYRSGEMAQRLQKAGFRNVFNLEGSIFKWANENRPVYRGNEKVRDVHPYNKKWGTLLKEKYHAYKPKH